MENAELLLQCAEEEAYCDYGSRIAHAEIHGSINAWPQRMVLEHVRADNGGIFLGGISVGDSSRISDIVIQHSASDALSVGTGTIVERCAIHDNERHGVSVGVGGDVTIRNCAFENNGGAGVASVSDTTVDARFNWWGDPMGPFGPAGDGVLGSVDYSEHLESRPQQLPIEAGSPQARTTAKCVTLSGRSCTSRASTRKP